MLAAKGSEWAQVVAGLLRPGGRLFIREGHPALWSLDENTLVPRYPYFEHPDAMVFSGDDTYVATDAKFQHGVSHSWNHSIGEIITALLDAGMHLTQFIEHDSVPWEAIRGHMTLDPAIDEWRLTSNPASLAATYTLQAVKQ